MSGGSERATLTIDDPVLADFAAEVGAEGAVAIEGGRTRWDLGGSLAADVRTLRAPTGVVEYKPEEMTIAVRAGTTVADLHAALAEKGQRTGLPERGGTIGGALAVGENDLRALGRGRVREAVLQVRYVSAEGRLVSSGGPTVKNVSGFDLPRLMVGSLGTLGLLAEVILRTNPIPEVSTWLAAEGADPGETSEVLLNPSAVLADGTTTWVELEGHAVDVEAQRRALATVGSFAEVDGPPPLPPHRWSVATSALADLAGSGLPGSERIGTAVGVWGLGLAFADAPQPTRTLDEAVALVGARMKENFDPTGRLNPGRDAARR